MYLDSESFGNEIDDFYISGLKSVVCNDKFAIAVRTNLNTFRTIVDTALIQINIRNAEISMVKVIGSLFLRLNRLQCENFIRGKVIKFTLT